MFLYFVVGFYTQIFSLNNKINYKTIQLVYVINKYKTVKNLNYNNNIKLYFITVGTCSSFLF